MVGGEGVVTGGAVLSYSGDQVHAGSYTVTATYAGDVNHTGSGDSTTIVIAKAALTVTADSASRPYSQSNPTFTVHYSGFMNGETLATSGVTGMPSLTTTATQASPVGSYTIVVSSGALAATNYNFVFVNGTLTVTDTKSIYLLNPTVSGALTVSGHSTINIPGLLQVDSSARDARRRPKAMCRCRPAAFRWWAESASRATQRSARA